ncbi:MAG: hypothetical protein LQ349_008277 [Xanthoria aureola]|nr:MAG: hypothetical protein LQ349_008277 [Xanthoria aureola]
MCNDGSYCCNDDALCCSKKEGKFVNARGNLISNPYTTARSESSTVSASSQPQPTSTAAAADASDNTGGDTPLPADSGSRSNGLSAAAKGGIGALAGVLVLVAVAASFFVWRTRRKFGGLKAAPTQTQPTTEQDVQTMSAQKHEMGYGPAELRVTDRGNSDGRPELASVRSWAPRELP